MKHIELLETTSKKRPLDEDNKEESSAKREKHDEPSVDNTESFNEKLEKAQEKLNNSEEHLNAHKEHVDITEESTILSKLLHSTHKNH